MSQSTERSRYRRFVFASAERRAGPLGDTLSVTSLKLRRSFRLEPEEFELARLFDGTRDANAVRAAAAELGNSIGAVQLEAFAAELSQADLLIAGTEEPLPVPPQTNIESRGIGWTSDAITGGPLKSGTGGVQPPSTTPGSLTSPSGLRDSLTGLFGSKFDKSRIAHKLPLEPFLPIGWFLSLPLLNPLLLIAVILIFLTGLTFAFGNYRLGIGSEVLKLLHPGTAIAMLLFGTWLVNFLSKLARAATIARYTGEMPNFGLIYLFQVIPWFDVESSGAPERTDRSTRFRIIGAVPVALMVLILLFMSVYLVTFRSGSFAAPMAVGVALLALVLLVFGLNPLIKRDGYFLLATLFRTPDLREQAIQSLFGYWRPWLTGPTLPLTAITLYALLSIAYMIFVCVMIINGPGSWLHEIWGPTGVVVFVLVMTVAIYDFYRRIGSRRGSIGNIRLTPPDLWIWIIVFTLAALSLFPYTFEPSGQFQVIARTQAEAHTLTSGDIRQVFVSEGDLVKAGQLLAKLNDDEQVASVAHAEGELESLKHQLILANQGQKPEAIDEAREEVETARTRYEYSRQESNRLDDAYRHHAISVQERDAAVGQAEVNLQAYQTSQKHLALVASPARIDAVLSVEAQIKGAEAQVVYAKQQLAYTEIRAPIDGRVVSQNLIHAVGHYSNRGDLVATIDADKMYLELDMPEYAIGDVKVGENITAKAYAYPGSEFTGRVKQISPAAQLLTTLGQSNGVNTAESQTSYNIIRVLCEVDDPEGRLRPDMTGYVKVEGRVYPAAAAFLRPVVRLLMVEIWSWLP